MNREKKIIQTSFIGIAGNVLLVAAKAIIGIIANSISIITDAINNLTDALSSLVTIIGTKLSTKKPDKKHPHSLSLHCNLSDRYQYQSVCIQAVLMT